MTRIVSSNISGQAQDSATASGQKKASAPALYTTNALFDRVKACLHEFLKARPDIRTALDVPAGGGALTKFLKEELKLDVAASDIDNSKWEYADVPNTNADLGRALPFSDASFDLVVCLEGLKHVSDVATAMKEISRVLKPDALALITIPNDLCVQARLRYLFSGFVDIDWHYPLIADAPEARQFLYPNSIVHFPHLCYLIEKNELKVIKTTTSRYRPLSVILGIALYPFIFWQVRKACKPGHILRKELLSWVWLAGRHNIVVCQRVAT